jgi:hypothetical protein
MLSQDNFSFNLKSKLKKKATQELQTIKLTKETQFRL